MDSNDLTIQILTSIRDEVRQTNVRLDRAVTQIDARFAETNSRIDQTNKRLAETEIRLATEIVALASTVGEVRDLLRDQRVDRARIDGLEQRVGVLEKRG